MNPLSVLATLLVVGGLYQVMRGRLDRPDPPAPDVSVCDAAADPLCTEERVQSASPLTEASPTGPVLPADGACGNAGYLCSDLQTQPRIRVQRWRGFSGTVVVHVPQPEFEDGASARDLQRAAARGIRYWSGQPFPIDVVEREGRDPHFSVRWTRTLGGSRIGVARTQWSSIAGLEVVALELVTRSPYDPGRIVDARQVELTAAHEMGHALGLPHSDSESDVMYPTSTARSLSTQDYKTMQALYALEDGTEIVR